MKRRDFVAGFSLGYSLAVLADRSPAAIAMGGWPMDDHPPQGFDRPELKPAQQIQSPGA
jgi:hypothetical protein